MHEVLVNRLGGLSLPRKSVVRLTDRHDMTLDFTLDVKQQINNNNQQPKGIDPSNKVDLDFWDCFRKKPPKTCLMTEEIR